MVGKTTQYSCPEFGMFFLTVWLILQFLWWLWILLIFSFLVSIFLAIYSLNFKTILVLNFPYSFSFSFHFFYSNDLCLPSAGYFCLLFLFFIIFTEDFSRKQKFSKVWVSLYSISCWFCIPYISGLIFSSF